MQTALHKAYAAGDLRLLRRSSALLEFGANNLALSAILTKWDIARSTFYAWLADFLLHDLASLVYHYRGGRPARLTATQKKQLCGWLDAGPQRVGFASACWSALLIQELIRREFGVLYNRNYVCELLHNLGYSFQKAQFVSDHLDEVRRQTWRTQEWPAILRAAQQRQALILFGDEVSFPQWGSLSYTWSRIGQTPQIQTSGKRKGYKVFGLVEFFSGRLFYQGIEGKFHSEAYQAFLLGALAQSTEHLFLIQDGAKYHTSKATKAFVAQHAERMTVFQLPSFSPDYNPIEYLWRKTKKLATHNKYFAEFIELVESVEQALAKFAQHAADVLTLFGFYCDELGMPREFTA
ncbi:MAG: IS630 family transposase [Anaerolineae bacterium]|nr:IS630 family transposase [Anaerolineae bacterium]